MGADVGYGAEGIAVFAGAGEDPAGGLQAGVGVRGDAHAAGDGDVVGAVVVDEAPGAHQALTMRRSREGNRRRTAMARSPPRGTGRGSISFVGLVYAGADGGV